MLFGLCSGIQGNTPLFLERIESFFGELGFQVRTGPEIEDDWHNFTALNIPKNHPARQMHDTFYLKKDYNGEKLVLRTHTSPVQIRTLQNSSLPIKMSCLMTSNDFLFILSIPVETSFVVSLEKGTP